MRRPTRDDVARHAGVSGWTVSHVLSGREDVPIRAETRERVLASARYLRYQPNNVARALVTGRFQTISLWTCLEFSQHRAQVVHRMQQTMKDSGYDIVIRDIEAMIWSERSISRAFQLPADGVIAFDTPTAGSAFANVDPSQQLPFVSMGGFWAKDRDFVGVDLYSGTVDAMEHLIKLGRRRIAYLLVRVSDDWPKDPRLEAYMATIAGHGLEPRLIWSPAAHLAAARTAVSDYLASGGDADAIFCHNDDMAFGAYRALGDVGLKVGQEVALIGCDGIEETAYLDCPLTTVRQPIDEMCGLAWEFLKARIDEPTRPLQQRVLKPQLVVRASSGA